MIDRRLGLLNAAFPVRPCGLRQQQVIDV